MKTILSSLMILMAISTSYSQVSNVEKANGFYSTAMGFYESKNYDSLIYYMKAALELRQDHPRILYNLAAGYALNGNYQEALSVLNHIADMKLYFPISEDSDFVSIRNSDEFTRVGKKFEENILPVINSLQAFRLNEKGLLTEGLAYDRKTGRFFISSVHKRKILEYDGQGSTGEFNSAGDSLLGIFGMRADENHGILWAVGGAVNYMQGFNEGTKNESILYKFDLGNGKRLAEYRPSEKNTEHLFGDLTIDSRGNVFVSDSRFNAIYKLPFNGKELETIIPAGNFISVQGIALDEDESVLFAADYSQGILKINLNDRSVEQLKNNSTTTLLGIDGLYFYKDMLIATQNGVNPQRILSLDLNGQLTAISGYKILESNNPLFDEPTLGVISGDNFYFISNSQWTRFDADGTIYPDEKLEYPLILKITLE
jgi:hypothetical protein